MNKFTNVAVTVSFILVGTSYAGTPSAKRAPSDICQSSIVNLPPCALFALQTADGINAKNSGDTGPGACTAISSSKLTKRSKSTSFQVSYAPSPGTDSKESITYSIVVDFTRGGSDGATCKVTAMKLCDNSGCDADI